MQRIKKRRMHRTVDLRIKHAASLDYNIIPKESDKEDLTNMLLKDFESKIQKVDEHNAKVEDELKRKAEARQKRKEAETKKILKIFLEDGDESAAELSRKATTVMNNITSLQDLIDKHALQEKAYKEKSIPARHYVALSKNRVKAFEEAFPIGQPFAKLNLWRIQELIYMNNSMPRMIFELINLKEALNVYELSLLLKAQVENIYIILDRMIENGIIVKTYAFLSKEYINEFKRELKMELDLKNKLNKNYEEFAEKALPYYRVAYYYVNSEVVELLNYINNRLQSVSQVGNRNRIVNPNKCKLERWHTKRAKILKAKTAIQIKELTNLELNENE